MYEKKLIKRYIARYWTQYSYDKNGYYVWSNKYVAFLNLNIYNTWKNT